MSCESGLCGTCSESTEGTAGDMMGFLLSCPDVGCAVIGFLLCTWAALAIYIIRYMTQLKESTVGQHFRWRHLWNS